MPRGGRRQPPGGAPKGNKRAVKHGRYSRDPKFRAHWDSLTSEQRAYLLPLLKESGEHLEQLPAPENIVPFDASRSPSSPLYTHTQTQQANTHPADTLARELAAVDVLKAYGCYMAATFIDQHKAGIALIEQAIAEFQDIERHHPEQLINVVSKGAFLKSEIHRALEVRVGRLLQCPHCGKYRQYVLANVPEGQAQTS